MRPALGSGLGPLLVAAVLATGMPPHGDRRGPTATAAAADYALTSYDVRLRDGGTAITVEVHARAVARRTVRHLEVTYCGPDAPLVSVDGSTVGATLRDGVLRAALHTPIPARRSFSFRLLTIAPDDAVDTRRPTLPDLAAGLHCRRTSSGGD